MDQQTLQHVHQHLSRLLENGVARVGFILNNNGRLLAHVGSSLAFHPQARFPELGANEEGENVYLTGVHDHFIVGAVFHEDVVMEDVRDAIEALRPHLEHLLTPYAR